MELAAVKVKLAEGVRSVRLGYRLPPKYSDRLIGRNVMRKVSSETPVFERITGAIGRFGQKRLTLSLDRMHI